MKRNITYALVVFGTLAGMNGEDYTATIRTEKVGAVTNFVMEFDAPNIPRWL